VHARAPGVAPALAVGFAVAAAVLGVPRESNADDCARPPPSNKLDTGARTREDVDTCMPEPPAAARGMAAAPATAGFWTTERVFAVGLAAAGVVAAGVGSALGLQAKSKYDDALAHECAGDVNRCSPTGIDQGRSAHDLAGFSTVAFVGAGALVGLGVLLFVLPLDEAPATRTGVHVVPTLGANEGGLILRARW
jgi:hypothetical protein